MDDRAETFAVALRSAVAIAGFALLDRAVSFLATLPASAYESPVVLLGLLTRVITSWPALAAVGVVTALAATLIARDRRIGRRAFGTWATLRVDRSTRVFVLLIAGVLAWSAVTLDHNAYFDRPYSVDRLVLLALYGLCIWRPAFLLPFVVVFIAFMRQLDHPFDSWAVAIPALLWRVLLLFVVVHAGHAWRGTRDAWVDFRFLAVCVVATSYWYPGARKLLMGWTTIGQIQWLLPSTHAAGWLAFVDPASIARATQIGAYANGAFKMLTLLLECGAVCVLAPRPFGRVMAIGWIGFHVAVFATSGILFWPWMIVDTALVILLLGDKALVARSRFIVSVVLIGGGMFWFRPIGLAWFETPATYAYRFTGVGQSGRTYELAAHFFAPYEYPFTLGGFHHFTTDKTLPITWGVTFDSAAATGLAEARSVEQILAFEQSHGSVPRRPERTELVSAFVRRFVDNKSKRERDPWWFIAAPPPVVTFDGANPYERQEPLTTVRVQQDLVWFDGTDIQTVRSRQVATIVVTSTSS